MCPDLPPLSQIVGSDGAVDVGKLNGVFVKARQCIQSELFEVPSPVGIPPFLLAGIIRDLYKPAHINFGDAKYNFAWIDADVLGRAYEKYLSTVFVPLERPESQLSLLDDFSRSVQQVSQAAKLRAYTTPHHTSLDTSQRNRSTAFFRGLPHKRIGCPLLRTLPVARVPF